MAFLDFARYFGAMSGQFCKYLSNTHTTVKRPFVQDYLGGPVPEKNIHPLTHILVNRPFINLLMSHFFRILYTKIINTGWFSSSYSKIKGEHFCWDGLYI